ncbi:MAG TPA: hypothetical protein VJN95_00230 [Gemmatimonadales bacterium]|nr:hypothetical protein [Gemmatimonadales bacterium]
MSDPSGGKRQIRTLVDLAEVAEVGEEGRKLLQPQHKPHEYLSALTGGAQHPDAIRLLAHALPRREGVWWAWVTAKRASGAEPPPPVKAALEATERWIAQPTEDNRRTAMARGEAAGFDTPAGCAALAAFLSGPTVAPAHIEQAVPPPEYAAAKAIAGAVLISAVKTEPDKAVEKMHAALLQGLEVVAKIKLWPGFEKADLAMPQPPAPAPAAAPAPSPKSWNK